MKIFKKMIVGLLGLFLLLTVVFLAGRYGWKVLGFRACQGAGIESVTVGENTVEIKGFYPGSFPEGFCGYYAEERDGKLYIGFRFSSVFSFFETGDFDVTIPVRNEIQKVILKTKAAFKGLAECRRLLARKRRMVVYRRDDRPAFPGGKPLRSLHRRRAGGRRYPFGRKRFPV